MQRAKIAAVLQLLLLSSAALTEASQAPAREEKPEEKPSSIAGRVLNAATGQPLARALLTLRRDMSGTASTVQTDEGGRFAFEGLAPGRYTLLAERAGFLRRAYGPGNNPVPNARLVLAAGQRANDLVFRLTPAASISGRVLDENNEPAQSMDVVAFRSQYRTGTRQWVREIAVIANDRGEFRLSTLRAGTYLVAARDGRSVRIIGLTGRRAGGQPEREYVTTFFPGATELAGAVPVHVAVGEQLDGLEIRWQRANTVRVRGRVLGTPEGKSAPVSLSPKGVTDSALSGMLGKLANSENTSGLFELPGVLPGAYMLTASIRDAESVLVASIPLQVGDQHLDGLVLQPIPSLELAGAAIAADKGSLRLDGMEVRLEPADYVGRGAFSARAGEDGKFTLKSILPSRYLVQVGNVPEGYYVKSIRAGTYEVGEDGLDLTSGSPGSLEIVLSPDGAELGGAVRNADDKPVSDATVVVVPDSGRYSLAKETRTDDNGAYSFTGLAPGDYKLFAWADIEPGVWQDPEVRRRFGGKAEKVFLKENEHQSLTLEAIPGTVR